ncbi:MAG: hypothetical protein OXC99_06030 [Chloroflexi bacterium]|nr:hypothetical protein [Chloroflexota bacterium]
MTFDNTNKTWLVSRRDPETGVLAGDLKGMRSWQAYFIRTDSFQPLAILRTRLVGTGSQPPLPPPEIPVVIGWNLVPVVSWRFHYGFDISCAVAADDYFSKLRSGDDAGWAKAFGYVPHSETWTPISPGDTITVAAGETNPCTGSPVTKADVEQGAEPCQAGEYIEQSPGGSATDSDVHGEFDGRDRVTLRAPLMLGKGYWVYASTDGKILPSP